MKRFLKIFALMVALFLLTQNGYSGVIIGSDMYFTTSVLTHNSNEVNPAALTPGWHAENTYLYVGLYPQISEQGIKGDAEIYINNSNQNNIYFGGAQVEAKTSDKNFTVNAFAFSPSLALSDPIGTGAAYVSDVYTSPTVMAVRFSDGSNTTKYPVIFDDSWLRGKNYALGGNNGVGISTKANILNGLLSLEDFFAWNVNNFDSVGALLKLNTLSLGPITLEAGGTFDLLKYKGAQDFHTYNAFYITESSKLLPQQSIEQEDRYRAIGGYINVGVMEMLNVYGQVKMHSAMGTVSDNNAVNGLDGMLIYAGLYTKMIAGSIIELNFTMDNQTPNGDGSIPVTFTRDYMAIKAKAYGAMDLETAGMQLFYLLDGGYISATDQLTPYKSYDFVSFTELGSTNTFTGVSGVDVKGSLRFDFLYMFRLRTLLRLSMMNMTDTSGSTYDLTMIENRTYLDIDLEDVAAGLWTTLGFRFNSYKVASSTTLSTGDVSYFLPYFEIRYVFGEDSFVRMSWGVGEIYSLLGQSYGMGYDSYKMQNSGFGTLASDNSLYNTADYNLANDHSINLEVGVKL